MPTWVSQILVALGAFIGGRAVTSVGERMQESRDLRRTVERLAIGVEAVPTQLAGLQGEIHRVGARAEAQMDRLTADVHEHLEQVDRRFSGMELRLDETARRIDGLAVPPPPPPPSFVEPRVRLRLDQERRCWHPADGNHEGAEG